MRLERVVVPVTTDSRTKMVVVLTVLPDNTKPTSTYTFAKHVRLGRLVPSLACF